MSLQLFLVVFAAVMLFTPGPNNIMVLSSGLTYGFRRTMPLIAGITFGGRPATRLPLPVFADA